MAMPYASELLKAQRAVLWAENPSLAVSCRCSIFLSLSLLSILLFARVHFPTDKQPARLVNILSALVCFVHHKMTALGSSRFACRAPQAPFHGNFPLLRPSSLSPVSFFLLLASSRLAS